MSQNKTSTCNTIQMSFRSITGAGIISRDNTKRPFVTVLNEDFLENLKFVHTRSHTTKMVYVSKPSNVRENKYHHRVQRHFLHNIKIFFDPYIPKIKRVKWPIIRKLSFSAIFLMKMQKVAFILKVDLLTKIHAFKHKKGD